MYEQRYEHTLRDWVKRILLATIRSAQIIVPIGVIVVMAVYPTVCYNHLEMIIGGLIMWEIGLALLSKMLKSKIWKDVLFIVALFTLLWYLIFKTIDSIIKYSLSLFASAEFSRMFGLLMCALIFALIPILLLINDGTLKALPISRGYKFCYVFFPGLSALFTALVIAMTEGIINPRAGEVDLRIYFALLAVLSVIVYVLVSTTYHQARLICKYKDVPAVATIMGTYDEGSVYVSYPIRERAVEDLIEYGVFVLRNPTTAKLCGNRGAWYNVSKDNLDRWNSHTTLTADADENTPVAQKSNCENETVSH